MEIRTAEEYVINKLFETENILKSTQEELQSTQEELLKAKETIKKLKEGIDIIAERAFIHQIYKPTEIEEVFRLDFNSILNDSSVYNTILDVLRTSEKFYVGEWVERSKKWSNKYD